MEQQLAELLETANCAIEAASDLKALDEVRVRFLGKKGELTSLLKNVGNLSLEEKPKFGKLVNELKQTLQQNLITKEDVLRASALALNLAKDSVDITLAGRKPALGSLHPVTQVKQQVVAFFSRLGFEIAEGPEIEDEYHNFTALNMPTHHPARGMHDTFYFPDNSFLLRTHTSPVQIRMMEQQGVPIRLISLGRVYRRDSDQTHTPMFHQVEGLVIEKNCSFTNLKAILGEFLNYIFATELQLRFRPSYFPFTEPSAEVDILKPNSNEWMEVLGCGMVHPEVLRNVGVDPDQFSGYAFGIGLDRLAMLRFGIPDLRMLFENDIRFLQQF